MRIRINADATLTPELLGKLIMKHKGIVSKKSLKLQSAYENDYEIYKQPSKESWKPDNRIAVNYAKQIVDTFNGFFCGIPIKTSSDDMRVSEILEQIDAYNDQDTNNFELSKLMDIHGSAHEMYYRDSEGKVCITVLSPVESFFICDDSVLERPLYFVRYYTDSDNIERGSFSDGQIVQYFHRSAGYHFDGEPIEHLFSSLPATEYLANREQVGLFEPVLPAIDAYNKALSEKANDVDAFADAYLKILGATVDNKDLIHIRANRVINFEGDIDKLPQVEFMARPSADETQEHLLDRLKDHIYQVTGIPNLDDENFGSASGVALRYKLHSMSNQARAKERRFKSGMNNRYKIIFSDPSVNLPDGWTKINYYFTQNYPANVADEVATAAQASGIISHESQIKLLSFIDDPKAELDRIDSESVVGDIYGDLS